MDILCFAEGRISAYAPAVLVVLLLAAVASGLLTFVEWRAEHLGWLWLALSVMVIASGSGLDKLLSICRPMSFLPWLWLVLSLLTAWAVLVVGYEHYGAVRHYGEMLKIRSGLWALIFHAAFLSALAQRARLDGVVLALAIGGTGLLIVALFAQPDFFSVLILLAIMLLVAMRARNSLRFGLVGIIGAGALLLAAVVLNSPYRIERFLANWNRIERDPFGAGFEPRMLAQAIDQAGWWGFAGDFSATAMTHLPANLEWYSLSYFALWLGNGAVVLVLLLLFALAWLVYHQARQVSDDTLRLCIHSGLLLYVLNLLWAVAGAYAHVVPNGHYGLPFLSAGQMTLVAVLLVVSVYVGRRKAIG